jgi:drug/metabolite transporter (DMT)-like permease
MAIFRDYIAAAIIFNLQILPETILSGLLILAVVLANGPVLGMAAGVAGTQLLAKPVGNLLMQFAPDSAVPMSSMDQCTQGYVGKSWARLLRGTAAPEQLWHPLAPSQYQATVGFLAGFGYALQQIYKDEIDAGVLPKPMMVTIAIVTALIMILALLFRIGSGCESILGAFAGLALGLLVGYLGTIAVAYATDRRAMNVWGAPLLRDRINNGSAVYVCGVE